MHEYTALIKLKVIYEYQVPFRICYDGAFISEL